MHSQTGGHFFVKVTASYPNKHRIFNRSQYIDARFTQALTAEVLLVYFE
jgi:hypothetical protein